MADYYTSAFVRRLTKRKGKPWCGVLKYAEPNPDYVEDIRAENQRRKARGTKVNPDYVEDTRKPEQRYPYVLKQVTKVFDTDATRAILNDPTATAPTTKSDANKILVAWHAQMEAEHAAPDATLSTGAYVKMYIDGLERLGTVTKSTLHDYRGTSRYLKYAPAIDTVPLCELTPRHVQAWEAGLLDRGLSGTTALKAHRLLKQVCKHAVEIDDLAKSPVRGFKAPSRTTGKPNALDAEGRRRAMMELDSMEPTPTTLAAMLALYTGMRRGEICALTWGNVDLKGIVWNDTDERGPKLRVSQAFGDSNGGAYLKAPKTVKGRRVIPMGGGIVDALKERRAEMWQEWSAAMKKAEIKPTVAAFNKLYVVGRITGEPYRLDSVTRDWKILAERLNLVGTRGHICTLHDLRHTNATMLITRGVDVASVADLLGHEQISTTLNMYTSEDSSAKRRAAMIAASDLDAARTGNVLPFVPRGTGTEG